MAANQRQHRERGHLPKAGWSQWETAMVPWIPGVPGLFVATGVPVLAVGFERRGRNQAGFILSSIRNAFPLLAGHCGIYEWQARGKLPRQPNHVVYVESTCRAKQGALRGRILEYCTNGSHKEGLINDALRKGYELRVRVQIVEGSKPSREDAEAMENALLNKYDYAWNTRINGQIRNILPQCQQSY